MKEYEIINNIITKKPTEEQFKKIYDCRQYFSEHGKKILDSFNISLGNEEYFDLRVLQELPDFYQKGIMNSHSHIDTALDEMLTEVKKDYVRNTVKDIEKSGTVEEIEDKLEQLKGIFRKTQVVNKLNIKDMGLKFFENLDKRKDEKTIKTKNWLRLNKNLKFYKGDVTVISGRPGAGKTALALSFALELAKNGNKGLFFSLEMGEEQIINRMMSQVSQVPLQKIQEPSEFEKLHDTEHERLQRGLGELKSLGDNLKVISGNFSSDDILRIVEEEQPEYIMIDYMQLLTTRQGRGRVEEITYLSMELKRIAMKCQIHLFELCQLSRAVEQRADKRPMLSDLRESGQIEQDASNVIGLYREGYYDIEADQNEMEVRILKNRNGMTGVIKYDFYGEIQKVVERI